MKDLMIKVCGMREPENILELSELPVDMIGFIFYPKSPRFVKGNKLEKWLQKEPSPIPGSIKRVGVFVNAEIEDILNRVHDYELDFVQLHGSESPSYCAELQSLWRITSMRKAELIKAFSVDEGFDFSAVNAFVPFCRYVLFDTKGQEFGGTGMRFNWELLQQYQGGIPFILSGGIDLDAVERIRDAAFPRLAGIDLNSRFERAPGLKEISKIKQFLEMLSLPENNRE